MSFVTNAASRAGKRARMYGNGLGQQSSNMAGGNLAPFATSTSTRSAGQVYSSLSLGSSTTNGITIHGPQRNPYSVNPNGTEKMPGDGTPFGGFKNFDIAYVGLGVLRFASIVSIPNIVDDVAIKGGLTVEGGLDVTGTFTVSGTGTIDPLSTDNIVINGTDDAFLESSLWADNTLGVISIGANNINSVVLGDPLVFPTPLNFLIAANTVIQGTLDVFGKINGKTVTDPVQLFVDHTSDTITIGNQTAGSANVSVDTYDGTAQMRAYGTGEVIVQATSGDVTLETTTGAVNINTTSGGNLSMSIDGGTTIESQGNTAINTVGNMTVESVGTTEFISGGNMTLTAPVADDTIIHPTQTTGDVLIGNASATTGVVEVRSELRPTAGISFDSGTNVLNHYEEGTWTPTITDADAVSFGGVTGKGRYVRVGNSVTFTLIVQWTSKGSTTTSQTPRLGGFPFPAATDGSFDQKYMFTPCNSAGFTFSSSYEIPAFQMTNGFTYADARKMNTNTGTQGTFSINEMPAVGFIAFTSCYITDTV